MWIDKWSKDLNQTIKYSSNTNTLPKTNALTPHCQWQTIKVGKSQKSYDISFIEEQKVLNPTCEESNQWTSSPHLLLTAVCNIDLCFRGKLHNYSQRNSKCLPTPHSPQLSPLSHLEGKCRNDIPIFPPFPLPTHQTLQLVFFILLVNTETTWTLND